MEKLKPCPFCGGEAQIRSRVDHVDFIMHPTDKGYYKKEEARVYGVYCDDCYCSYDESLDSEEEAISIWNKRVK